MEDIFHWCREGNTMQVRIWLDDTEHDLNLGDDHMHSPLHWAAKEGHLGIVEMLLARGARINATNMGDDTPLHLATAHGHKDVVSSLKRNKAEINAVNEHGCSPLHYACFWGYQSIAEDLIESGALISISSKYNETPLDKCKGHMAQRLHELASQIGQDLKKVPFKDTNWLGSRTRSRDATLSRHSGIPLNDLKLENQIAKSHSGEVWRSKWQGNNIVAKVLSFREFMPRFSRDFNEEFPRLRIFSHPNILPVIGCCNSPPNLVVINQYMRYGSLYSVLHEGSGVVVDTAQALIFALHIAKGMQFLHQLEPLIPKMYLNSKHIMIDDDLTAKISMADVKFSFHEKSKMFDPAWMSPETLQKKQIDMNIKAGDMWSFAILLWEMSTRQIPFADLSSMEIGMKIALEGLRVSIPPGISSHMSKLIRICMNEDPGKRPSFDLIVPILEKMKGQ